MSKQAWSPGDDPGRRLFATLYEDQDLGDCRLELELGATMDRITVAYETWGVLSAARDNAVLIEHALTGDSHAAGPDGWWEGLIGPGAAIDTDRWFVVCPNVLGGCQGTTGPSSPAADGRPWGSRFPELTIRDQVSVEAALADRLGIDSWAAVVGGSMGGMRAVEWAVTHPARVTRLIAIACCAASTAEQIALCSAQAVAIRNDPSFAGGDYYGGPRPVSGLGLVRRIGHISYRSEGELAARFGRRAQPGADPSSSQKYAVEGYLDYHAAKLVARFDANSYLVLSQAMNHHDVGRGRGGLASALARVTAAATVVAIDSDRLYWPYQQAELAELLPGRPDVQTISSECGHDGFLIETEQVGKAVATALAPGGRPF